MTFGGKSFQFIIIAATLLTVSACGRAVSPTAPGTLPSIARLTPSAPLAGNSAQTMSVTGQNFSAGLTFFLRSPTGTTSTFGPGSLTGLNSTSFTVVVTLDTAGLWTASVRNSDGTDSAGFQFSVSADQVGQPPVIASVSPAVLVAGPSAQLVSVTGSNFRTGATVIVTDSSGLTVSGVSVLSQADTLISANVVFSVSGSYSIVVRNLDGSSSQAFSVTVVPA